MAKKKSAPKKSAASPPDSSKPTPQVRPETALPEAEFLMVPAHEMDALMKVLKQHEKMLRSHKGVYKVDVGYRWKDGKMTGEIAIRVHVKKKKPVKDLESADVVPDVLDGFPVDVIQSNLELQRTTRRDPLVGGIETRNVNIGSVGTLGAIVFDAGTNQPLALSNHHVYVANRPNNAVGDRVNQPGTTVNPDTLGVVNRSHRGLDCAVATRNGTRANSTSIIDFPGGIKGVVEPMIGMRVAKSGRTTGTTMGMVEGVSSTEFTVVPVPGAFQELSLGGDSGAVWLEQSSHAVVGLHYAGETSTAPEDERAWAKRATRVATALNINFRQKAVLSDTSMNGPALAALRNVALLGWTGSGNLQLNFMRSTNGLTFTSKVTLGETSPASLALTVFKDRFVVAWIGVGNNRLNVMQSTDGRTWTNKVTLGDTSRSAPSLAVFNNELYMSWRGVGNNQLNVIRSGNGTQWGNKRTLGDTTTSGPALAAFDGRLRLAWRGVGNNQLNIISSADGLSFSSKRTLGDTTTARPYLLAHRRRLFYAWQGVGNRQLNILESTNGTSFAGKLTLRETCVDGPALASLGDNFLWSWTGTDARGSLNTLLYDLL
jgi:hypothetical protein